jgi:hypothetical protein
VARQSSTSTSAIPETAADRYLRTGTPVPMIYPPGSFALAAGHAKYASAKLPGEHLIESVRAGQRTVLQVWEDGTCTWVPDR